MHFVLGVRALSLGTGTHAPCFGYTLAASNKWLPTAPGVCSRCGCVHCCVCGTLDGLYAEHEFRVGVTILGPMSLHFRIQKCIFLRVTVYELAPDITCAQHGNPGLKMHLGFELQWETPEDHAFLRWTCLRSVQVSQSSRKVRYVYLPADWQVLYADVSTLCRAVEQQVWLVRLFIGWLVMEWHHGFTHALPGDRPDHDWM